MFNNQRIRNQLVLFYNPSDDNYLVYMSEFLKVRMRIECDVGGEGITRRDVLYQGESEEVGAIDAIFQYFRVSKAWICSSCNSKNRRYFVVQFQYRSILSSLSL